MRIDMAACQTHCVFQMVTQSLCAGKTRKDLFVIVCVSDGHAGKTRDLCVLQIVAHSMPVKLETVFQFVTQSLCQCAGKTRNDLFVIMCVSDGHAGKTRDLCVLQTVTHMLVRL